MKYSKFMANMYHYLGNDRKEISGFSKFEVQGDIIRITMKLCLLKHENGVIRIYLLTKRNGSVYANKLREDKMRQRVYTLQRAFDLNALKEMSIDANDIKGVYIIFDNKKHYMSLFENENIKVSDIKIQDFIEENDNNTEKDNRENQTDENSENQMEEASEEKETPEVIEKTDEAEIPVEDEDEVEITAQSETSEFEKTDLIKLRSLPKKAWALGKNSFLLHGFYNYRHIAVKKEANCWVVGVPGIYHPKEEKAAALFGFKSFCPESDEEIKNNVFGYWCMSVDISE